MSLQALIFDVDGTLADTEEAHRQSFNQAFCAFGLTPPALLRAACGKERIASHIESVAAGCDQRGRLQQLIPEIHAAKTTSCVWDSVACAHGRE